MYEKETITQIELARHDAARDSYPHALLQPRKNPAAAGEVLLARAKTHGRGPNRTDAGQNHKRGRDIIRKLDLARVCVVGGHPW